MLKCAVSTAVLEHRDRPESRKNISENFLVDFCGHFLWKTNGLKSIDDCQNQMILGS